MGGSVTRYQKVEQWVLDQLGFIVGWVLGIGVVCIVQIDRWKYKRHMRRRYR